MCEVTDWFERQGELRKAREIVLNMERAGIGIEEISKLTNVKLEVVQEWIEEVNLVS